MLHCSGAGLRRDAADRQLSIYPTAEQGVVTAKTQLAISADAAAKEE